MNLNQNFTRSTRMCGLKYWRFRLFYNNLGRSWVGLVLIR